MISLFGRFLFTNFLSFFRFQDEIGWAFKMFDIDNSGSIVVEEIHQSVQVLLIQFISTNEK